MDEYWIYQLYIFDFSYIYFTILDRDSLAEGKAPLDGLAIYANNFKMEKGAGAGVVCPNLMIKHSYKHNNKSSLMT